MNKVFMSLVVGTSVLGLAGYGAYRLLKDVATVRPNTTRTIPPEQGSQRLSHQVVAQLAQLWEILKAHSGEVFNVDLVSTGESMGAAAGPGATNGSDQLDWETLRKRGAGCGIMGLTVEEMDKILDEIKAREVSEAAALEAEDLARNRNDADLDQEAKSTQDRVGLANEDIDRLIAILASSTARLKETATTRNSDLANKRVRQLLNLFRYIHKDADSHKECIRDMAKEIVGAIPAEDTEGILSPEVNQIMDDICHVFHLTYEELSELFLRLHLDTEDFAREPRIILWHRLFHSARNLMNEQFGSSLVSLEIAEIRDVFYDAIQDLFLEILKPCEEDLKECLLEAGHTVPCRSEIEDLVF